MVGKLIVFESWDGCGKQTQTKKLFNHLQDEKQRVKMIEYPNYKSKSSALIKMYLNGDFGKQPDTTNAYAATLFYAVDRYASFKIDWQSFYETGGTIIADRYTTSNMVHQAVKIKDMHKRIEYLDWLCELEFKLLKLPVPDIVIFLDIPPKYSLKLIADRAENKCKTTKDIHENNTEYLIDCYNNYRWLAKKFNWQIINCVDGYILKSVNTIHEEIYNRIISI